MSERKRQDVLNQMVADLSQFSAVIHQVHWYMRGEEFLTLHPKMDEWMDEANELLDEVAERLIIIGGSPYSTLKEFVEHTNIPDTKATYSQSITEHMEVLLKGYRLLRAEAITGIEIAGEAGDSVTEDLFIDIQGTVEKNIWMLTAKLGRAPEL